jgi:hypothetical protein
MRNATIPETTQNPWHDCLHAHGCYCLGHDEQAGLDRGEAQACLIDERQEKWHSAEPKSSNQFWGDF